MARRSSTGSPTVADPALVLITWHDAWIDGTEPVALSEVGHAHKPQVIKTLGWLLRDDEAGVSVACEHYAEEDVYRGRTFIPRGMIVSVMPYNLSKPRRHTQKAVGQ